MQDHEPAMQRMAMLHCHTDRGFVVSNPRVARFGAPGENTKFEAAAPYPLPTMLPSAAYKTAMCPNWLPPAFIDPRSNVPEHLEWSTALARQTPFSPALIARLDSATRAFPDEPWFIGHLVRVRTENGQFSDALGPLRACGPAIEVWCAMLQAYGLSTEGQWKRADAAFQAIMARLPLDARCQWRSVEPLLAGPDSAVYARRSCAERDPLDPIMWWLATPFFADGANLRAVEHFARLMRNQLVMALPLDPYHDLRPSKGGDAIALMRIRYGWTQHEYWGGEGEDQGHTGYDRASNAPPFPAAEYSRANRSTFASWRAVNDPYSLADTDYASEPPTAFTANTWWPSEFYLHPRGITLRLPLTQRAMLRRDSSALIFVATELRGGRLDSMRAATNDLVLMESTQPGVARELDRRAAKPGERVVLSGAVRDPALISLEYLLGMDGIAGARSRFGVPATPLLRPLARDACEISDPMLLRADAIRGEGTADIARGLLGNVQLIKPQRIGVAWESYGFHERDTVDVSLEIVGAAALSTLQRAGRVLGIVDDPRVGLSMAWREPNPAHVIIALNGQTPTLLRELVLDLSNLRTGEYQIVLSMTRRGCPVVHSQRAFSVAR